MKLNYKKYGDQGDVIIILHGLFGMLDNWQLIAKHLSKTYQIYTLDLRNHGLSPHSDVMDYHVMANDVYEFVTDHQLNHIILLGHSMGGKVAMEFSNLYSNVLSKLIIVDIAPKSYPISSHDIYFTAFESINLLEKNRKLIEQSLENYITDRNELLFLLKNLDRLPDDTFRLKINVKAIKAHYQKIRSQIEFIQQITIPTIVVLGENSGYITLQDIENYKQSFTNIQFVSIPNAGHWVHAENAQQFLKELEIFLTQ